MRKLLFLVLLFIIQNAAFSQDCDSLLLKAVMLMKVTKYIEALDTALLAEKVCGTDTSLIVEYAEALMDIGLIWQRRGNIYNAIAYHDSGLVIYKANFDTLSNYYLKQLIINGLMYKESGDYKKAISIFQKIEDSYKKIGKDTTEEYFNARLNIVQTISAQGYLVEANKLTVELTNAYLQKFGKKDHYYYTFINELSNSYRKLGQNEKAIAIYEAEMQDVNDTSLYNRLEYKDIKNNLAYIYYSLGILDKAIYINETFLEYKKIHYNELPMDYAWTANHLGAFYTAKGEFVKAEEYLLKAAEIRKSISGENNLHYAFSLNNIGKLYYEWGKYDKSIKVQKNLLDKTINNPLFEPQFVAIYLHNYAETLCRLKQYDSSIAYFKRALAIRKELFGEQHLSYVETLNGLARVYMEINKTGIAKTALNETDNLLKKIFINTLISLTENDQRQFLRNNMSGFDLYNSILFKHEDDSGKINTYSNSLFLKSLSLNETKKSLQSIRNSSDTAVQNIFQNLSGIKNYLSKQYTLPIAKQVPNLKDKEAEAQDIEQQLALKSADFRRYEQSVNVNVSDVYKALKPGEAAIEFTSFKYYSRNGWTDSTLYAALILTAKDSVPHWVYLFEEKQLKNILFTVHPNLLYSNAKIFTSPQQQYGDKLYNLIWKKIEPQMAGINTVYYSPSGILNQVALAAIPFNASSKTISSKYKLVQLGSTKNIVIHEPEIPVTNIALMGGISYNVDSVSFVANTTDSSFGNANIYTTTIMRGTDKATKSFEYLPATLTEVNSITATAAAASVVANVYTEHNATEEAFKKMDRHSPSVLHIATHGFYLPYKNKKATDDLNQTNFSLIEDPMLRSGIALAGANLKWSKNIDIPNREDGIVTAYEIVQMDLSKTELVVLSACESGLGDIDGSEGVFGLQRGFKSAGVNKLILTLWQVPDKATMEFMTLFYNKWLKEKKGIRTSFADTQKTMSEKYKAEPYKWAGFVLIE